MKIVIIFIKITIFKQFDNYFCKHKINACYNSFIYKGEIMSKFCDLDKKMKMLKYYYSLKI